MRLLLNIHVFLWWHHEPSRLSERANNTISDLDNEIFLSVVNDWEIQIKAQLGKLTLSKLLSVILEQEQTTNNFSLLPITMDHVYTLDHFPLHHRDPFDRLLVAQAQHEGMTLVTHRPSKNTIFGPNSLPGFWTRSFCPKTPILT